MSLAIYLYRLPGRLISWFILGVFLRNVVFMLLDPGKGALIFFIESDHKLYGLIILEILNSVEYVLGYTVEHIDP